MDEGEHNEEQAEMPPPPPMALEAYAAPPPSMPAAPTGGGVLLQIGDIGITGDQIITPNGNAPLAGSSWIFTDQSRTEEKMPTYAIILAIVFFLACLLGLLFLLIKETKTTGYGEVRVQSGGLLHMTQIPVSNPAQIAQLRAAVGQAQSMAQMV